MIWYAMICCNIVWHVVLCPVVSCCIMTCYDILDYVMSGYAVLCDGQCLQTFYMCLEKSSRLDVCV